MLAHVNIKYEHMISSNHDNSIHIAVFMFSNYNTV